MTILGIPISPLTTSRVQEVVLEMLKDADSSVSRRTITTPNAEMILSATTPAIRSAVADVRLRLPDGTGLQWAASYLLGASRMGIVGVLFLPIWLCVSVLLYTFVPACKRWYLPERITGSDTLLTISRICEHYKCSVFLLGSYVADEAAAALQDAYPDLVVAGAYEGTPHQEGEPAIRERINASGAHVLFVAYGAPAQEQWIQRNLPYLPNIRIAMGVGGAFDFLAGSRTRAPRWMQQVSLEWLWRLFHEPSRIGRIFNATARFTWRIFIEGYRVALDPRRLNL